MDVVVLVDVFIAVVIVVIAAVLGIVVHPVLWVIVIAEFCGSLAVIAAGRDH